MTEKIGVCATGKGPFTRSELKDKINASEKYYFIESINDSVKILLCEDPTANSSKLNKAKEKGIQLVKYEDFDFGEIPSAGSAQQEPKSPKPKKSPKKATSKKIDPKAQLKNEEEALRLEKMRERVRKGLQKYESLPKEYTNSIGMEFVLIPPGEYVREEGYPPVFITEPYYMGKYPVTQGEWLEMMKNPSMGLGHISLDRYPFETNNQNSILEFIIWLIDQEGREYKLPSGVEWEYAAGLYNDKSKNSSTDLSDYAWTLENSEGASHPVGEKKPNSFGLYDMLGNAWELSRDWYTPEQRFQTKFKGGSWKDPGKQAFHSLDKIQGEEKTGFRLVLRDLGISESEYKLGAERRKKREEKSRLIQEWKENEKKRREEFEKLPKEYINSIGMEFVLIPAGEFLMGLGSEEKQSELGYSSFYNNERNIRVVITRPFYIGKYPVTQGEWVTLMDRNPSEFRFMGDRPPIENVNRLDCQKFMEKLNEKDGRIYRLPTEAEWEYAARGSSTLADEPDQTTPNSNHVYTYGDDPSLLGDYAWYDGNSYGITHPVGQKKPNAWGLYDMIGNASEWCEGFVRRGGGYGRGSKALTLSDRDFVPRELLNKITSGLRLVSYDIEFTEEALRLNQEKLESKRQEQEKKKKEEEIAKKKWEEERNLLFKKYPKEYVNSLGMELVLIPPGEYLMGAVPDDKSASDTERPQHKVRITKPFYIGKYPITQEEWESLMGNNPSKFKESGKQAPVDSVSWDDCKEFTKLITEKEGRAYRLPTEAEWEYAARGGGSEYFQSMNVEDQYIYKGGISEPKREDIAWYSRNTETTRPVGQKEPNSSGLYDMIGNIREWCEDWSNGNYYNSSPESDPLEPKKGTKRILRGGYWDNYPRTSSRESDLPESKHNGNGFRIVLSEFEFTAEEISLNKEKVKFKPIEKERRRLEEESKWIETLQESRKVYESLPKEFVNSLGMEFVLIPPGEFLMGAVPQDKESRDEEKPRHKVRITKPFYIGKYPITQGEWEGLMGKNPSEFKEAGKRAPVESVSWKDCQEYIKTLNQKEGKTYRLPKEAEWEYAARGGSKGSETSSYIYTYGDDPSVLGDYAWYEDNSNRTTHPVGEKKPNSIGLYDMMGNVCEWCGDWYDSYYYFKSSLYDPKGANKVKYERRSLRGGSWYRYAGSGRLSNRYSNYPDYRLNYNGFRLVLLP